MLDINGETLQEKGHAQLLCEVLEIEPDKIRLRILNSELELAVGCHFDEVLGQVADPELTAFTPAAPPEGEAGPIPRFE